jgi:hypothetical protein
MGQPDGLNCGEQNALAPHLLSVGTRQAVPAGFILGYDSGRDLPAVCLRDKMR